MDKERARKHIEPFEGYRTLAYPDSKGIMTVGIGFNLEDAGSRAAIEALKVDYDALLAKQCELTDEHVVTLFNNSLDIAIVDAVKLVPDFWNQPEDVQLVVVDMLFNMGGPRFSKFVKFLAALEVKDYLTAADEMANSKWAKDVPSRAAVDIDLVRGCAT